jgi:hypothetical protein
VRLAVEHGGDLHAQLAHRQRQQTPPLKAYAPTLPRHEAHSH